MKPIRSMILIVILLAISLELYILLAGNQKFDVNSAKKQQKLSSQDVMPQPVKRPLKSTKIKIGWYFEGYIPPVLKDKFDEGVVDETYFPYYENGEIHPPKRYDVENNYTEQDIEKMKRALRVVHRYADINKALEDGYLIHSAAEFSNGTGAHVVNIDYILDDEVSLEKPDFLNYVKNYKTGLLQLVQIGFLAQRTTPYKLFDAEDARGHFHVGNFCYFVHDNIYFDNVFFGAIKDRSGSIINPWVEQDLDIFSSIENSELKISGDSCEREGGRTVSPLWMMHFAVNMYNDLGMFTEYFYYIDYLSSEGITHSFYGKKITL